MVIVLCQLYAGMSRRHFTCAMRWCCRLMTLDMAICMLPNTATTSNFLSSNDGAPKFWTKKMIQVFTSKQIYVLEVQLHFVLLLSQHSHYPPWCLPRSWYHLHSWGCWAQLGPADSAVTWERRRTEARERKSKTETKTADSTLFPKAALIFMGVSPPAEPAAQGSCRSSGPAL